VYQVEYAGKAVDKSGYFPNAEVIFAHRNSSTVIGIKCSDGVILAVEKLQISKMLLQTSNKRIYSVDRHVGVVFSNISIWSLHI
jgi:20S proteasome subunit alpha 7